MSKIIDEKSKAVRGRVFFAALLAGTSLALAQTPTASPTATSAAPSERVHAGLVMLSDVVFGKGGTQDLHAEIAYPQNATKPLPAVIFIHGGGWFKGSQKQSPIAILAGAGFFAASIEYRFSDVAKWPAQIEDCKLAVRWLRANAAKYNVDPNRIGVWGESAGGHLVACLGTMGDVKEYEGNGGYPGVSSAVQAVVDYFGPTDFTRPEIYSKNAAKFTEQLFGVTLEQKPDVWKSGSPAEYVKAGDPPMLLIHGGVDKLVPLAQSQALDQALTKAGVPHEFIIVKNGNHGFKPDPGTAIDPSKAEIQAATLAFLNKYLKAP